MTDMQSGPSSPPTIKAPVCPDCSTPMKLKTALPDERYTNISHAIFECDCGRTSDHLVASA
jgi:hypothetical protein